MGVVSANLKPICQAMVRNLQSAKSSEETLGAVKVDAELVSDQGSISKIKAFTVVSDEPETSGGKNAGPSPLGYFMSSIGFCQNLTFARQAALLGLDFDALETTVIGRWERKGQFGIDDAEPSFREITVEMKVISKQPIERVAEVARLTRRRCPLHTTLAKATKVTDRLLINGQDVAI